MKLPSGTLPSKGADQATQATKLVEWAEHQDGPGLKKLEECYYRAIEKPIENSTELTSTPELDKSKNTPEDLPSNHSEEEARHLTRRLKLTNAFIASVIITALVLMARSLGWMQTWELQAFDSVLRLRLMLSSEEPDPRLLIVEVTDEDIQHLKESPLTDQTVLQLLEKLQPYEPRVIGLDIYRDVAQPEGGKYPELLKHLQGSENVIAVCKFDNEGTEGSIPPSGVPGDRLGFTNYMSDEDGVARRYLLSTDGNDAYPCQTSLALGFQLAFSYLAIEGIKPTINENAYIQFDHTVLTPLPLEPPAAGYQRRISIGYQMMLYYRASDPIARTVTLSQILNGHQIRAEWIRDKVVMIGYSARDRRDLHPTPYTDGQVSRQMPGVVFHAHMVSQILSAVLDSRPLLQIWSQQAETIWIWIWSLGAGGVVWILPSKCYVKQLLGIGTIAGTLLVLCYVFLLVGFWVPLIPPLLVLVATSGFLLISADVSELISRLSKSTLSIKK